MTPRPEGRRILRFWTGTRPGLEWIVLASVPALVVGIVVRNYTNGYVGYLVGIGILVAAVFVRPRRRSDANQNATDRTQVPPPSEGR